MRRTDSKDMQIREQQRKIETLEEACQDLENTITQFRDLVQNLQRCVSSVLFHATLSLTDARASDLNALRAQTQTAQNESATAASQTAAMMSLNLKLQSSASKNQAKHIELEIKKLEAKETRELLSIVQVCRPRSRIPGFLPEY